MFSNISYMKEDKAGNQRRNVGAGTEGEAREECCLLAFYPTGFISLHFYLTQG